MIIFGIDKRRLDVELSDDEMAARLADWRETAPAYTEGVFAKYALLVSSASEGAITQPSAAQASWKAEAASASACTPRARASRSRAR